MGTALGMVLARPVPEGEAGTPVTVVSLPARGRPPEAAARRAGLEFVEKRLPTKLTSSGHDGVEPRHAAPRPAFASLVG
jgi:hypothetical protein